MMNNDGQASPQLKFEINDGAVTYNGERLTALPVNPKYGKIRDLYVASRELFWVPAAVDLSKDKYDWDNKLDNDEREYLSKLLAFFAASDKIVNINIEQNLAKAFQSMESGMIYRIQLAMEDVHNETYSNMINVIAPDIEDKNKLFNAIANVSSIRKKAEWCFKYINKSDNILENLIAFACVEGILFSSSFAGFYWARERKFLPGMVEANEYIARDEAMHTLNAVYHYELEKDNPENTPITHERIREIVAESVEAETEFVKECLPNKLINMNADEMIKHVHHVADNLLKMLGVEPLYGQATTPLVHIMEAINNLVIADFFSGRVSSYKKTTAKDIKTYKVLDVF